MFKFIHAADIHLDSPLRGLEQYEGAPVEEIRNAARRAFERLIDLAIDQQVAFVLIAGDFYDGDWRDYNTGLFFIKQINRLRELNIPVYLIAGNHDAANNMTRQLRLPEHVHFFSPERPETKELAKWDVVIHGQSFANAATFNNLSLDYPQAVTGPFHIGLLHTCASSQEHERYAPCSLDDLRKKDYDYWALGHVHQRQILSEAPWIGFSGNLQGRHIRETGPKGCLLVSVDEKRQITSEFVALDVLRWERARIGIEQSQTVDEMLDQIRQELETLHRRADQRLLAVRVELHGASAAHQELQAKKHHWIQEIRSLALSVGQGEVWLEKVKLETSPPALAQELSGGAQAALGELQSLFAEYKNHLDDEGIWREVADELVRKLPDDLRGLVQEGNPEWIQERLNEAEAYLFSELLKSEESA